MIQKLDCMYLSVEAYDFPGTDGKQVKGDTYRFLVDGREVKIRPARDAKIVGCDRNPKVPVFGVVEYELLPSGGYLIPRFHSFTAATVKE